MPALIVLIAPFVTSALTGWLKNLTPFTSLTDVARTPAIRLLAAVVSLVYILFGMWVSHSFSPDGLTTAVTIFSTSLLSWLGSLGIFHAFFQSKSTAIAQP